MSRMPAVGIGAQQAGGDRHGHAAQQFKGGELGLEASASGVVLLLVAAALQHHRAAVGKLQPQDVVPVPDLLRGPDLGPLTPGAGQHRLGGPLLASGQHGARCGVGHASFSPTAQPNIAAAIARTVG